MTNDKDAALDVRIGNAIEDKDKISVKSSKINQRLEHYILKIITGILKKHGQDRFTDRDRALRFNVLIAYPD